MAIHGGHVCQSRVRIYVRDVHGARVAAGAGRSAVRPWNVIARDHRDQAEELVRQLRWGPNGRAPPLRLLAVARRVALAWERMARQLACQGVA